MMRKVRLYGNSNVGIMGNLQGRNKRVGAYTRTSFGRLEMPGTSPGSNERKPKKDDAVLGGQSPQPKPCDVVLSEIERIKVKIARLKSLIDQERSGSIAFESLIESVVSDLELPLGQIKELLADNIGYIQTKAIYKEGRKEEALRITREIANQEY